MNTIDKNLMKLEQKESVEKLDDQLPQPNFDALDSHDNSYIYVNSLLVLL